MSIVQTSVEEWPGRAMAGPDHTAEAEAGSGDGAGLAYGRGNLREGEEGELDEARDLPLDGHRLLRRQLYLPARAAALRNDTGLRARGLRASDLAGYCSEAETRCPRGRAGCRRTRP